MVYVPISNVLSPDGLSNPNLEILYPDADLYTIALLQPKAVISAGDDHVRNLDVQEGLKHENFFRKCHLDNISVAVTPEYSTSWTVLENLLTTDCFPAERKVWVIGMESITRDELNAFYTRHSDNRKIYFENLTGVQGRFFDPVCYLFRTRDENDQVVTVILIQFKTNQMAGEFERDRLIKGNSVYVLSGPNIQSIKLITLICADTLGMNTANAVEHMGTQSIVIHIQLNTDPRNRTYAEYRNAIFNAGEDTEIICLNWASNIYFGDDPQGNPSGSCFYLKSRQVDLSDERISLNHLRGMYYAYWKRPKVSAYYFNHDEHVFILRTPKPFQFYSAFEQRLRNGPVMTELYSFDQSRSLVAMNGASDRFAASLTNIVGNLNSLQAMHGNPIDIERMLEISLGLVRNKNWKHLTEVSYFKIDDMEILKRVSYAQEQDLDAVRARSRAIANYAVLVNIVQDPAVIFPIQISSLKTNSDLRLIRKFEHSNLISNDETEHGTVVYLGENPPMEEIKLVYSKLKDICKVKRNKPKRIVVWYRTFTGFAHYPELSADLEADQDEEEDETSIDRSL